MPGDAAPNPAEPLTGRGEELELIRSFTAGLAGRGGALLLAGAHLYQIFPKLGISTRAALRDALARLEPAGPPASR
jgi:hypothetical protein